MALFFRRQLRNWAWLFAYGLVLPAAAQQREPVESGGVRRFALIVGNNVGGTDTKPLLYAQDDARKVQDVLTRLGGVRAEDTQLVLDRSANDVFLALKQLEARALEAAQQGARSVLLFYYSGHAKDGVLRLGTSRLSTAELKVRLNASPMAMRISILDSCRSGAVTRTKGARRAPAFEIESSGAQFAEGTVFLASSSFDEDSQESDELGGSYFSHHLVTGLRGEADQSRDGKVTLSEAYAYAYARTVADTAQSAAGAQHPTFSYDLKGHGDLVLSHFAAQREGIYFPAAAPEGMYYLIDSRGFVEAEVQKTSGRDRVLALPPGKYWVKRRLADHLRIGEIVVQGGALHNLDETQLKNAPFADDPVKGIFPADTRVVWLLAGSATYQTFLERETRDSLFPPLGMLGIEAELRNFLRKNWVWAFDVAVGNARGSVTRSTVVAPFEFRETALGTSIWTEWSFLQNHLRLFAGARVAMLSLNRRFEGEADTIPEQSYSTFTPGLVLGARYFLGAGFSVLARSRTHYVLYNVDGNRSLGFSELALALGYEF